MDENTSVAGSINQLTNNFESYFDDTILSLVSTHVGSFYSLFGVALTCFLIFHGSRVMLGLVDGKEFGSLVRHAIFALLFLTVGYVLIPGMDFFGKIAIDALLPENSNSLQSTIDKNAAYVQIRAEEYMLSENDINNVKSAQAAVDPTKHANATIANAHDFNEEGKSDSFWALLKSGLASLISTIFLIVGTICKMIMTFFMLLMKGLLRITFPVAVSLSLIFKAEKALQAWWESYITVVMLGVILAALSAFQSLLIINMMSLSLDSAQLGICIMAFAFGVAYLCAPSFAVMCFGGSQAVAQLPQQISTSMMGAVGIAKSIVPKAAQTPHVPKAALPPHVPKAA